MYRMQPLTPVAQSLMPGDWMPAALPEGGGCLGPGVENWGEHEIPDQKGKRNTNNIN